MLFAKKIEADRQAKREPRNRFRLPQASSLLLDRASLLHAPSVVFIGCYGVIEKFGLMAERKKLQRQSRACDLPGTGLLFPAKRSTRHAGSIV
ncbi:MAG: hypothetical protein HY011_16650 [Acidobacteria bacterium]|nr:hypothetical protein [Acidobacteriota bacterium]